MVIVQLAFVAVLLITESDAFIPDYSYGVASPTSVWHSKMTEWAVNRVVIQFLNEKDVTGKHQIPDNKKLNPYQIFLYHYGLDPYSWPSHFAEALKKIMSANKQVDKDGTTKDNPTFHFDAERFLESNKQVQSHRATVTSTVFSGVKQYEAAWTALGQALHTLQDFYSHSNWIEMGNKVPLSGIGMTNPFSSRRIAGPNEPTCSNCDTDLCTNNILPSINTNGTLTSGYYGGQSINGTSITKPLGVFKCSHGGKFDSTRKLNATGGIAKDADNRLYAPHSNLHSAAAQMAEDATVEFLNDLRRDIGDDQFADLMGLYVGTSLAIVMDTTGSMESYIATAKARVTELVEETRKNHFIANYILVPFNDPTYGPVFTTTDPGEFIAKVDSLTADGGGDCPEMSMSGTLLAAQECIIGSPIFVFTDMDAKDYAKRGLVAAVAAEKGLSITYFGYIGCGGRTGQNQAHPRSTKLRATESNPYYELASLTGGLVFTAGDDSLFNTTAYMGQALNPSFSTVLLATNLFGEVQRQFYVEASVLKLTVTATGRSGDLPIYLIIQPDGSLADCEYTTDVSSIKTCLLSNPAAGMYTLNMTATTFVTGVPSNVIVSLSSYLSHQCDIYILDQTDPHGYFIPLSGNPIAGSRIYFQCSIADNSASISELVLYNAANGTTLESVSMEYLGDTDMIYVGNTTVPTSAFLVGVSGSDATGVPFQRINVAKILPTRISLEVSSVTDNSFSILPGGTIDITFNITNYGQPGYFLFNAADSQAFLQSYLPHEAYIASNGSTQAEIVLVAPNSIIPGSSTRVTMSAMLSDSTDETNFLQIIITVVPEKDDTTPPTCTTTFDTIGEICSLGIVADPARCAETWWNATFEVQDADSGIGVLYGSSTHGNVTWTIPDKYEAAPGKVFNITAEGNCCAYQANLHVVDMVGQSADCYLVNPYVPTTTTTTTTTSTIPPTTTKGTRITSPASLLAVALCVAIAWARG